MKLSTLNVNALTVKPWLEFQMMMVALVLHLSKSVQSVIKHFQHDVNRGKLGLCPKPFKMSDNHFDQIEVFTEIKDLFIERYKYWILKWCDDE